MYLESVDAPLPSSANQLRRLILLALLASAGHRGLSRDKLIGYLWAERREDLARHALEQLLYATRRDLGRETILSESGGLRLNPGVVAADVVDFESALRVDDLAAAVRLYGGPFLDGVYLDGAPEFENWVERQRARLQERFAKALESLAQSAARRGDFAEALEYGRQLAAVDPLNTNFAMVVIRTLAQLGDRAEALREAQRHEDLIRRELEIDAGPSFRALVEALIAEPVARPAVMPAAPPATLPNAEPPGLSSRSTEQVRTPRPVAAAATPPPPAWSRRHLLYLALAVAAAAGSAVIAVRDALSWREASATSAVAAPEPVALEFYLRGRTEWNRRSREGLQQAVVLFR